MKDGWECGSINWTGVAASEKADFVKLLHNPRFPIIPKDLVLNQI